MVHTKASKKKLSKMRKGAANPFYGKKHTQEAKDKMSKWTKEFNSKRQYDLAELSISFPCMKDRHYLAGIIDGEGSIRFHKERPFVAVYNCNKDLIDWLLIVVGGKISGKDKRGRQINYCWKIYRTRDVYWLLKLIINILIVKKEDAEKVMLHIENKYGTRI